MSFKIAFFAAFSLLAVACGAPAQPDSHEGTARGELATGSGNAASDDDNNPPAPPASSGDVEDPTVVFEPPPDLDAKSGGAPAADGGAPSLPSATYEPCDGKVIGDECTLCAPWDTTCVETAVVKVCTAQGSCE